MGSLFERVLPGLFQFTLDGDRSARPDPAIRPQVPRLAAHARHHRIEPLLAAWLAACEPVRGNIDGRVPEQIIIAGLSHVNRGSQV